MGAAAIAQRESKAQATKARRLMGRKKKDREQKLAAPGTIGLRILDLRQKKGLEYEDLIEACKGVWRTPSKVGVSRSWLMKLEKGRVVDMRAFEVMVLNSKGEPEARIGGFPAIAARLCKVLGVTPEKLLEA